MDKPIVCVVGLVLALLAQLFYLAQDWTQLGSWVFGLFSFVSLVFILSRSEHREAIETIFFPCQTILSPIGPTIVSQEEKQKVNITDKDKDEITQQKPIAEIQNNEKKEELKKESEKVERSATPLATTTPISTPPTEKKYNNLGATLRLQNANIDIDEDVDQEWERHQRESEEKLDAEDPNGVSLEAFDDIIEEGPIEFESATMLLKSWHKRWLVLRSSGYLSVYSSPNKEDCHGHIDLRGCEIREMTSSKSKFKLQIFHLDKKPIFRRGLPSDSASGSNSMTYSSNSSPSLTTNTTQTTSHLHILSKLWTDKCQFRVDSLADQRRWVQMVSYVISTVSPDLNIGL
eukprot:TRINITY_DN6254_c0_g1_i1.p1 TRINITY_DN6254_c0_g1~~TRINITY_DN6254_c0_g1_i1.p1  ORF type:complete len:346 (+),score=73.48 TRINITY_DN6254_c0_g1_i1:55-1092(+)